MVGAAVPLLVVLITVYGNNAAKTARAAKENHQEQDRALEKIHVLVNDRLTKALTEIDFLKTVVTSLARPSDAPKRRLRSGQQ